MKSANIKKGRHSLKTRPDRDNKNNGSSLPLSTAPSLQNDGKLNSDQEDADGLAALKDNSRLNISGTDNDLATDIQDSLGRETALSVVIDNINVTVEGEIVTLKGTVNTEGEIMLAGDIATALAGENNVNNLLSVINIRDHNDPD